MIGRRLGALVAGVALAAHPAVAATEIRLPVRADLHPPVVPLPGTFPSRIPARSGTIAAQEHVMVGVASDGSTRSVTVEQAITIGGVGDYTLEITGPAADVEALDGSDAAPGLRNGAIIWEGFSPGARTLRARVAMDLDGFRFTSLPLTITRAGGRIRIVNATARSVPIASGGAGEPAVAAAIAAVRAALERGEIPRPGTGGIPRAITVNSPVTTRPERVAVPMRVTGTAGDTRVDAVVTDAPLEVDAPAGASLRLEAVPVLPALSALRDGTLSSLLRVLHQSARVAGEGYLGLPVDGAVDARYTFVPYEAPSPAPAAPDDRPRPEPVPIAAASMLTAALIAAAWRWWATH